MTKDMLNEAFISDMIDKFKGKSDKTIKQIVKDAVAENRSKIVPIVIAAVLATGMAATASANPINPENNKGFEPNIGNKSLARMTATNRHLAQHKQKALDIMSQLSFENDKEKQETLNDIMKELENAKHYNESKSNTFTRILESLS